MSIDSPLHLFLALKRKIPPAGWPQTFARADGKPLQILKYAATKAFWKLGIAPLRKLINAEFKHVAELQFHSGAALPEILHALIKHVLQCSDAEDVKIMALRAMVSEGLEREIAIVSTDEVSNNIDESDLKEIDTNTKQTTAASEATAMMRKHLRTFAARPAKKLKRSPVGTVPDGVRPSVADANALLAPRSQFLRDEFNGRWQVWYRGAHVKSSSSYNWGSRPENLCISWRRMGLDLNESLGGNPAL